MEHRRAQHMPSTQWQDSKCLRPGSLPPSSQNWFTSWIPPLGGGGCPPFPPATAHTASCDGVQMRWPSHGWSIWTTSELAACTAVGDNEGKLPLPHWHMFLHKMQGNATSVGGRDSVSQHFTGPPFMLPSPTWLTHPVSIRAGSMYVAGVKGKDFSQFCEPRKF